MPTSSFAPFADALLPGFTLINPDGRTEDRAAVVDRFRARHGGRAGRDFRIEIQWSGVCARGPDWGLVRYDELWWEGTELTASIRGSALLRSGAAATGTPAGIGWQHLHETWVA